MNDQEIQSLWNQSKQQEPRMDGPAIRHILEKSVRQGWGGLRFNAWLFLGLLGVVEVFNLMNLVGFASHPSWLAVHAGLTALTLGFMIYALRMLQELRTLDDPRESLSALVRRQLRFFHTTFEGWLWMAAATAWLLSFSVSVWMENQGGGYRINRVIEFVAVSAGLIFGSYAIMRLRHYPMVQRSLAALHDLESQLTDQTERVNAQRKYWVIGGVLLVIALTLSVIWGIKVWLSATP